METQPLDRIEDHASGETPEDVAILYSWANLQGAKYRDFSANRREYRAQMRHRAAEQLRLMELKAQSEAEAAAAQAEAEAAAAHADADAATARLAASRNMPAIAPEEIQEQEEVEYQRRSSLREAAQQARRAAAERLEAARRAEAAALADSIARREEREIAEAQASALRQAAQYADSELRSRQMTATQPEKAVPGRISDPYSPQVLAEGEYFESPGTPVADLAASRFRQQRDYIERATGAELPPFRMPGGFNESGPLQNDLRPAQRRPSPEWLDDDEQAHRALAKDFDPRKLSDLNAEERDIEAKRKLREGRNSEPATRLMPDVPERDAYRFGVAGGRAAVAENRGAILSIPHGQYREPVNPQRTEIVSRIQGSESEPYLYRNDGLDYKNDYDETDQIVPRQTVQRPPSHRQTRAASDHAVDASFEQPHGSLDERGHDQRRDRAATSFDGNPVGDYRSASPNASSEPLYRPEGRPGGQPTRPEVQTTRPPMRANEQADVRSQSPRPSLAEDYWSDALSQTNPRAVEAAGTRSAGGANPVRVSTGRPDPEWLEQKAAEPNSMPGAQLGGTKPRSASSGSSKGDADDTLQSSRERVASRWFALKEIFAHTSNARSQDTQIAMEASKKTPIIAVFSMAGGVGKTSLVATLGRTLSSLGEKVLLADTTSHGLLPFYFGASELVPGVVRTFSPPKGSTDAPITLVNYSPDLKKDLKNDKKSQGEVVEDLLANSQRAHRVLIDLDVNCRWLVERVARLQPTVLVPLSADMNSIISLQSVERSFGSIQDAEGEPLRLLYLLNQFDPSQPLHLDVREVLRQQLGDRLLPFVIRKAAGVSEALAEGMTIVDYDPDSAAAQDYLGLANWIRATSAPASLGLRSLRWSER